LAAKELIAQFAEIQVPDTQIPDNPADGELYRQRDTLPVTFAGKRKELVDGWAHLLDEEDSRHRELLFASLREQKQPPVPEMDRRHIDELDRQILELSDELVQSEMTVPTFVFTDENEVRLLRELEDVRNERKRRIRQMTALSREAMGELLGQLENEMATTGEEHRRLTQEIDNMATLHQSEFDRQRQRRRANEQDHLQRMEELEINFRESCINKALERSRALETLELMIRHRRLENDTERKQFEFNLAEAKLRFETEWLKLGASRQAQGEKEEQERGRQLDLRLIEATRERNRARDQFVSIPMRREEQIVIQKLEKNLAFQTQQLATVGKEVLQYRHQLSAREDLYNGRFGAEPAVAVMPTKGPKVRPATNYVRRLPRLGT
jgi:hypothetical protein